nr:MAG TPA: hypothetical protein [Bacteriophage sp.]
MCIYNFLKNKCGFKNYYETTLSLLLVYYLGIIRD